MTTAPRFTLGVDLGKDALVACLLDHAGRVLGATTAFECTPAGLRKLLAWLPQPRATRVVFESTGVYGKGLVLALDGLVASLHQLNPRIVKRRAASSVQTKTDHADARAIATVGHDLALTQPGVLEHARVGFDPALEDLALWLAEFSRHSHAAATLKTQIQTLEHNPAPAAKEILRQLRRELRQTLARKDKACRQMDAAAVKANPQDAALVRSVTGLGPVATAALLCKVRDVRRFESADALKGYLGIYPRRVQSGSREAPSRMATHGCAIVRHVLWNCAKVAARHNARCKELFERLRARGKHPAACYGAVARLLVQLVYGVLTSRRPFENRPLNA